MLYALTLVAAGLLVGADEKDPLVGTWTVVSVTHGGQDDPKAKDSTATFKDGKVSIKEKEGEGHGGAYKVDTSKKPATIDIVPDDGPQKGKTMKGIFAIEKGELKICFAMGDTRPTALSSKAGEETVLIVFKKK